MEIKKLYELLEHEKKEQRITEATYWDYLWELYVEEKSADYQMLAVKEAIPRLISDDNLRKRRHINNCMELGLNIKIGDICYIDYGEAYINEYVHNCNINLSKKF